MQNKAITSRRSFLSQKVRALITFAENVVDVSLLRQSSLSKRNLYTNVEFHACVLWLWLFHPIRQRLKWYKLKSLSNYVATRLSTQLSCLFSVFPVATCNWCWKNVFFLASLIVRQLLIPFIWYLECYQ